MITRQIYPNVPPECQVSGFIYEASDVQRLGEDMVDVVLPNGILVTAGWFPDGCAAGKYRVSVYRGYDQLISPLESACADDAARNVEQVVSQFIYKTTCAS